MTFDGARALAALRFINYTEDKDDVWRHSDVHLEGLHRVSERTLSDGLAEACAPTGGKPIGVVVQGQRGTGKTHLLGWARERTQENGGYFVYVELLDAKEFWATIVTAIIDSFARAGQLRLFLERLALAVDVPRMLRRGIAGKRLITRAELDTFVARLRDHDEHVGREAQDVARALVLYASPDHGLQDVGEAYLQSIPEVEPGERAQWGIRPLVRSPQETVGSLLRLLALTGPIVVAVDQLDALVAQSRASGDPAMVRERKDTVLIDQIAAGLMGLRELSRRTLTVVCCLPTTWTMIEKEAVDTVRDRFRQTVQLMTIPDAATAERLIARRFAGQYDAAGVEPPYPTWPVRPEAFAQAAGRTPRALLITIDRHVSGCLMDGEVRELERFDAVGPSPVPMVLDTGFAVLDARFEALLKDGPLPVVDGGSEDTVAPSLLAAGLRSWIAEQGRDAAAYSVDPPPSAKPPLHARLRRTLDEATEDETHWAFRVINAEHPRAALTRITKAVIAAGLDADVPKRRLYLLRGAKWSEGPRTRETLTAFAAAGGRALTLGDDDLRVLAALRTLLADDPPGLAAWLATRRPARRVTFLAEALPPEPPEPPEPPRPVSVRPEPQEPPRPPAVCPAPPGREASGWSVPVIPLGGARVAVEALKKHTVVFAGSGSGKTVLIRRLVEECALRGVPAIVLDPNNDLARLGDAWPSPPPGWGPGTRAGRTATSPAPTSSCGPRAGPEAAR